MYDYISPVDVGKMPCPLWRDTTDKEFREIIHGICRLLHPIVVEDIRASDQRRYSKTRRTNGNNH